MFVVVFFVLFFFCFKADLTFEKQMEIQRHNCFNKYYNRVRFFFFLVIQSTFLQ